MPVHSFFEESTPVEAAFVRVIAAGWALPILSAGAIGASGNVKADNCGRSDEFDHDFEIAA